MGKGSIDDGVNLLEEAEGSLRGALGHLHALQPYLDRTILTW